MDIDKARYLTLTGKAVKLDIVKMTNRSDIKDFGSNCDHDQKMLTLIFLRFTHTRIEQKTQGCKVYKCFVGLGALSIQTDRE